MHNASSNNHRAPTAKSYHNGKKLSERYLGGEAIVRFMFIGPPSILCAMYSFEFLEAKLPAFQHPNFAQCAQNLNAPFVSCRVSQPA